MAQKINIIVDQGTTYSSSFVVYDDIGDVVNLSTYTVASQIRKTFTSTSAVSFTATGNSAGYVNLLLTANATSNITSGRYVYDVELTSNTGVVTRAVEGIVTITPQVTK